MIQLAELALWLDFIQVADMVSGNIRRIRARELTQSRRSPYNF
jgi:hypothetical protein